MSCHILGGTTAHCWAREEVEIGRSTSPRSVRTPWSLGVAKSVFPISADLEGENGGKASNYECVKRIQVVEDNVEKAWVQEGKRAG